MKTRTIFTLNQFYINASNSRQIEKRAQHNLRCTSPETIYLREILKRDVSQVAAMECLGISITEKEATMLYQRHKLIPFMILTASLLLGCAGTSTQESTGEYLDDSVITAKVKSAFVADKQVSALDIQVTTFKGVVQLSGFASSRQEIDRAVELAREVPGVKSVKNDIRRAPQSTGAYLDDSAITAKVKSAFMADREVSALNINVETNGGVVQLSGFASGRQEIDQAIKLARNVQGVKSVENNIQLK
jgi:hyperosmotically inducible protein